MGHSTLTLDTRLLLRRDPKGQLTVRRYRLRLLKRRARAISLVAPLIIGSGSDANLRVEDPTVSRKHFLLTPSASGVALLDLGSKNGTLANGVRVAEALLEKSAMIQAGSCQFELTVEDERLPIPAAAPGFGAAVGLSSSMQSLFGMLATVAPTDSTVLLTGPTGTGKGLLARELHQHSHRRRQPFVVVECGALNEELAESTLFGHVRGAFTGADKDHEGAFLRARGGTLFLEDVGELIPALQPRLLRALESQSVQRVGATAREDVDVRVVAATSAPLLRPGFRVDLYYRLAVIELTVPALEDRPGDVRALAEHFAASLSPDPLPADFLERLEQLAWPGNVRELQNAVERSLVLAETNEQLVEQVLQSTEGVHRASDNRSGDPEHDRIIRALGACAGNQSAAAKLLGISRGTLINRISRLNLPRPRLKR